jgi:hypothetical protein
VAIVIKKCPHCKKVYESGHHAIGIGEPLATCQYCKGMIVDKDNMEWELKGTLGKIGYLFVCFWTVALYGLAVPLGIYGIAYLLSKDKAAVEASFTPKAVITFWIIGVILASIKSYKVNTKDIQASKERMKNPEYRALLRRAGLLKG